MKESKETPSEIQVNENSVRTLASIFSSKVAQTILLLLYEEARKGCDEHGKLKGLYFNDICRKVAASRTTIHKVLGELVVHYSIISNEYQQTETPGGKRVATVYRIKPEIIPLMKILDPFLPAE